MSLKIGENVWVSNSCNLDETPRYSASHPDKAVCMWNNSRDWRAKGSSFNHDNGINIVKRFNAPMVYISNVNTLLMIIHLLIHSSYEPIILIFKSSTSKNACVMFNWKYKRENGVNEILITVTLFLPPSNSQSIMIIIHRCQQTLQRNLFSALSEFSDIIFMLKPEACTFKNVLTFLVKNGVHVSRNRFRRCQTQTLKWR